ncbi:unnamed protein product [Gordionus sp. m RMFG-2023]
MGWYEIVPSFVLYATFFVAPAFILPAIHLVFIHKPNARHVAGYFNRPMLKRDIRLTNGNPENHIGLEKLQSKEEIAALYLNLIKN